ncbi:MAG TPA: assimilatory sulfite reductase (NADPH) flavoprotein subunit [Steroidobacteraceae bacterium]|nr:assimilatory sulfite reductase (NADPH) flavoprotein subunit [Steroidobacteraceae bacterium]
MARMGSITVLREPETGPEASAIPAAEDPWRLAPLDGALAEEVRGLVGRLGSAQRLWLSGYLAGSLAPVSAPVAATATGASPAAAPVTILFGSESGNSQRLAQQLARRLGDRQAPHRVLDMMDCRKVDLEQAQRVVAIVSTHGDGDPPETAHGLFELLAGNRAPALGGKQFAVLALGDSSYEHFCAAGRKLDARLEQLGAQRLLSRVDCDVDFEAAAEAWLETVSSRLAESPAAPAIAAVDAAGARQTTRSWNRKNPLHASTLANQKLTMPQAFREVRHVELSLPDEVRYAPGDALGVVPRNDENLVAALLARLGFDQDTPVQAAGHDTPLRTALLEHREVAGMTAPFLQRYAEATASAGLLRLAQATDDLKNLLHGRDLLDLVQEYPPRGLDAATLVELLPPLAPRLYSISSSALATPGEVHLTVGLVAYQARDRVRRGVVSGMLADLAEGQTLPVYLHRNEGFRLPTDPRAPIVMVGAGTGVAPYRGFLAEREASGATGRNWLVFGNRAFEHDFLYQSEWLTWRRRGLLARLDVAFSRDQVQKCYVQHRLREQGALLWAWLNEGAHLYLCGDAQHMAPDVEHALLEVFRTHGGLDEEAAAEHLRQLRRERRYQKDVY